MPLRVLLRRAGQATIVGGLVRGHFCPSVGWQVHTHGSIGSGPSFPATHIAPELHGGQVGH